MTGPGFLRKAAGSGFFLDYLLFGPLVFRFLNNRLLDFGRGGLPAGFSCRLLALEKVVYADPE